MKKYEIAMKSTANNKITDFGRKSMKKYRLYFMNVNNGKEFFIEVNSSDEIQAELNKKPQYLIDRDNWECFDQEEIKEE